jgi:2-polyprenyl-6-methoxyphenol hydroxylase-like FAD-dependent oxidoreductase
MNIIVVGAGIGGLAFALSAHRLGLSVRLYESVAQLLPLGVGINLQPNAVRELTELRGGRQQPRSLFWNDLKFSQVSHLPVCPKASGQTLAPTVANKQC